jgi:hypothetical protein
MTGGPAHQVDPPIDDDKPIGDAVSDLLASGKDYAQAELRWVSLRGKLLAAGARDVAIAGVFALVLLLALLTALLVGLILALTPQIGPWWSLLAVCGGTLLVLLIVGLVARARVGQMMKALR